MSLFQYTEELKQSIATCNLTTRNLEPALLDEGLKEILQRIRKTKEEKKKVIFIGNGGSASIAGHMAVDFWKRGGIKAITFNDASLLTCVSNDFCYEMVFSKPLEQFAEEGDLLFAISSSGKSLNIINAVQTALEMGCFTVTLSGFSPENPLRKCGDRNLYVPHKEYGIVEMAHHVLLHYLIDEYLMQETKMMQSTRKLEAALS